jgi:uncharacterized membrane protein YbhN (UPF0104 family)
VTDGLLGRRRIVGLVIAAAAAAALYRAIAFWLPTVPGALAYVWLRRSPRSRRALTPRR